MGTPRIYVASQYKWSLDNGDTVYLRGDMISIGGDRFYIGGDRFISMRDKSLYCGHV